MESSKIFLSLNKTSILEIENKGKIGLLLICHDIPLRNID